MLNRLKEESFYYSYRIYYICLVTHYVDVVSQSDIYIRSFNIFTSLIYIILIIYTAEDD